MKHGLVHFTVSKGDIKIAVNASLVQSVADVEADTPQTAIIFDSQHRVVVDGKFEDVVKKLNGAMNSFS